MLYNFLIVEFRSIVDWFVGMEVNIFIYDQILVGFIVY